MTRFLIEYLEILIIFATYYSKITNITLIF